jgi:hypothetical protein
MKIIKHILFIVMIFCTSVIAQIKLSNNVVGSGGAIISNSNHILSLTIAQPIIGNTSNTLNTSNIGFWYQHARTITDVEDRWMFEIPKQFELHQNYPNPFNPTTVIRYGIPKESNVKLVVYNILGEVVKTLVENKQKAGSYEVNFNASNLATGIYIYRIQAGSFVDVKKMILIK